MVVVIMSDCGKWILYRAVVIKVPFSPVELEINYFSTQKIMSVLTHPSIQGARHHDYLRICVLTFPRRLVP